MGWERNSVNLQEIPGIDGPNPKSEKINLGQKLVETRKSEKVGFSSQNLLGWAENQESLEIWPVPSFLCSFLFLVLLLVSFI